MSVRCRTTFWRRTLDHARRTGDWVLVQRLYTHSTAAQLVSDISNAHRRAPRNLRIRGIDPGERWEARSEPAVGGAHDDHRVWIRCTPPTEGELRITDFSVLETV